MKHLAVLLLALILLSVWFCPCLAEDVAETCRIEDMDQPLYEEDSFSIRIAEWMIEDEKILIGFTFEREDGLTCLLICNETAAHMDGPWEPGFSVKNDIQEHSFGKLYYIVEPGDDDPYGFSWDKGEIYDHSTYGLYFKEQPMSVRICEVNGFPAGYHVGFTFVVTALDPYYLYDGSKEDESLRVINIQIIAPSDP